MNYQTFFNLDDSAFRLTPDPDYYYPSKQHNEALETLIYSVDSGVGFVQITGDPGVGKTLLIRSFIERLGKDINTALILYPHLTGEELFKVILEDLGLAPENLQSMSKEILLRSFRDILLETAKNGTKTIVIIDEAQELPEQTLEELRLLSNLETDKTKLLQIVLVGQRELEDKLNQEQLKQLHQRITIRYRLRTLSYDETVNYIHHRLKIAGGGNMERFPPETIKQIHTISNGVPRIINSLCERSLMAAFVDGKSMVGLEHVDNAIDSLEYNNTVTPQPVKNNTQKGKTLLLPVMAALLGGIALYFSYDTIHQLVALPGITTQLTKRESSPSLEGSPKDISSSFDAQNISSSPDSIQEDKKKKNHLIAQTTPEQQSIPKKKNNSNRPQQSKYTKRKGQEPEKDNLNKSSLPLEEKKPLLVSSVDSNRLGNAELSVSDNIPHQSNPIFLPPGWKGIIIDEHNHTAQMYSSGQSKAEKTLRLPKQIPVNEGIYLLGRAEKKPFFFNHRSFSGWQVNQSLDQWIRAQFFGDIKSPPLIPVVVISGQQQLSEKNADTIQTIQTMVKNWADAFSQKNISDLMVHYDDSLLTYQLLHNRPTVLSHGEVAKQKTKIFKKNKAIALQISQPGCIVDSKNSARAVVFFYQRFISSSYSDSGIKVMYLCRTSSPLTKWLICGRLWLPTHLKNHQKSYDQRNHRQQPSPDNSKRVSKNIVKRSPITQ